MRILFNIGHPAQVHFFKYALHILQNKGHTCKMTAVSKDVSVNLLQAYNIEYELLGNSQPSLFSKATELIKIEKKLYKVAKSFKPDIIVGGSGSANGVHIAKFIRKPSIVFEDSEKGTIEHLLTDKFATIIFTPASYRTKIGDNQIFFNGYKEIAYLHPKYFQPREDVLQELNLTKDDKFIVFRFVTWNADHDIGHNGIENKVQFVKQLEKYAHVLITSEGELESELEKYRVKVAAEKLHDVLSFAQMFVGDSQTMATEAALLGIPVVRCNSFVGKNDMSNFIELEQKYGLIFNYNDSAKALAKSIELIQKPDIKEEWKIKRQNLFNDKINMTDFIVWFIENYPQSIKLAKEDKAFDLSR